MPAINRDTPLNLSVDPLSALRLAPSKDNPSLFEQHLHRLSQPQHDDRPPTSTSTSTSDQHSESASNDPDEAPATNSKADDEHPQAVTEKHAVSQAATAVAPAAPVVKQQVHAPGGQNVGPKSKTKPAERAGSNASANKTPKAPPIDAKTATTAQKHASAPAAGQAKVAAKPAEHADPNANANAKTRVETSAEQHEEASVVVDGKTGQTADATVKATTQVHSWQPKHAAAGAVDKPHEPTAAAKDAAPKIDATKIDVPNVDVPNVDVRAAAAAEPAPEDKSTTKVTSGRNTPKAAREHAGPKKHVSGEADSDALPAQATVVAAASVPNADDTAVAAPKAQSTDAPTIAATETTPAANTEPGAKPQATPAGNVAVVEGTAKTSSASSAPHGAPRAGVTSSTLSDVDRVRFVQRVSRALQTAGDENGSLRLRLSPPELGSVRLDVSVKDGVMTARLEAETPEAKQALLDNFPELKTRLAEHDIHLDRFEVDLADRSNSGSTNEQSAGNPYADRDPGSSLPRPKQQIIADLHDQLPPAPAERIVLTDQLNVII